MTETSDQELTRTEVLLLKRGRGEGLATAAIALGALSFIQLLGAEKALLAIALAVIALRDTGSPRGRRRAFTAIALGAVYLLVAATTLVIFHDRLGELIRLVKMLG